MLLAAALFMKMSIGSATYYGWYWIAFFPILLYTISRERSCESSLAPILWLCIATIVNFVQQLPLISDFVYQKAEQIRVINNFSQIQPCLIGVMQKVNPATIYNLTDFGLKINYPAKIYDAPSKEAESADVRLVGIRTLVNRRMTNGVSEPGYFLQTSCDSVLVFVKQK
jgi:hypothetical protein